ncbi:hypothetical protein C0J52_03036 [Blattella germanica]|nr:hypothetical protein C0J52_03036 [Blattella germanica]
MIFGTGYVKEEWRQYCLGGRKRRRFSFATDFDDPPYAPSPPSSPSSSSSEFEPAPSPPSSPSETSSSSSGRHKYICAIEYLKKYKKWINIYLSYLFLNSRF